ncbi:unnamed protein product [Choristocarpus tenellus]
MYKALAEAWSSNEQYKVLCDIIQTHVGTDQDGQDEDEEAVQDDPTLFDTFYRYLVLFGVPAQDDMMSAFGKENPVWKAVGPLLWVSCV